MEDLREFLSSANLSTYEINAYILLLQSNKILKAREISNNSNVPYGRIYEVLETLRENGMIEIIESRPKKYKVLPLNTGLFNLINHHSIENKRKEIFLYNQARNLESTFYNSNAFIRNETSKIFWSTVYGKYSIGYVYNKHLKELQEELLMIGFIDNNTIKILPSSKIVFRGIKEAINRGVEVKFLWSFEYDERTLTEEQKAKNKRLYGELSSKLKELFNLSTNTSGFEMKIIHKKIPFYYDIFDRKRIILKLQNPLKSWQIFACINVIDINLAKELRDKFNYIWSFETSN